MTAAKARLEPRDRFSQMPEHPQVHNYGEGTRSMARRLARALKAAIDDVERAHALSFLEAPNVYVCDADCFRRFSTMQPNVPAAHFMDSIFMNEPELRAKEQKFNMAPERFLVHELTHLLFYQYAGPIAYMRTPAWFREGWAVAVSGGAGAQACSPQQAAEQLLAGASFDPSEEGSLFENRTASSYGLRYPLFYRQSGMFVAYLQAEDRAAFQKALRGLFAGMSFQASFEQAYGRPVASYWPGFKQSIRKIATDSQASR